MAGLRFAGFVALPTMNQHRGAPPLCGFAKAEEDRGGVARVVQLSVWARDEATAQQMLRKINGPIHKVRGRIEKIFGPWKRSYGMRTMAHRGLAKASLQVRLCAIAYNLKRSLNLLRATAS